VLLLFSLFFIFGTVPQFSAAKTNKIIACVDATLGCIRKIVKSDYLLCFCPSVSKNSAPTGRICMKYVDASRAHRQSLVHFYFRTSSGMYCSLAIHIMKGVAACRQTIQYSEKFFHPHLLRGLQGHSKRVTTSSSSDAAYI